MWKVFRALWEKKTDINGSLFFMGQMEKYFILFQKVFSWQRVTYACDIWEKKIVFRQKLKFQFRFMNDKKFFKNSKGPVRKNDFYLRPAKLRHRHEN